MPKFVSWAMLRKEVAPYANPSVPADAVLFVESFTDGFRLEVARHK